MNIKERAQVLYDFSICPNKECENCAASGVICDITNMREARDKFYKETAEALFVIAKDLYE